MHNNRTTAKKSLETSLGVSEVDEAELRAIIEVWPNLSDDAKVIVQAAAGQIHASQLEAQNH